jgi:hypothetical protein
MKLFNKLRGLLLGKEEIGVISGQIYNYVVKKKLVYFAELEPFFSGLHNYEKLRILEHLKKEESIVFEEDMFQIKNSK